jgi:hypothetical protein
VRAGAEDLSVVAEDSVDVVTTRSLLIYVEDKERAFRIPKLLETPAAVLLGFPSTPLATR